MDTAPGREMIDQIREIATATPGVDRVEKCFVRKVGYQYFVDMHVEVDPQMTVLRSHEIAHAVKDKIRGVIPAVTDVLVHIEPLGLAAEGKGGSHRRPPSSPAPATPIMVRRTCRSTARG
jgi:divalent metal cation (Fe/Co/Zn/Cd) transporter